MKKTLSLVMILCLLLGVCGTAFAYEDPIPFQGTFPLTQEPIELNAFTTDVYYKQCDFNDVMLWDHMKELTGVDFTFEDPVEYPGLRIKRTPTWVNGLLFAAFGLMVLGLWFCFFQTPAIVALREDGYTVAGPKPQGLEMELAALLESDMRNEESQC